mgnify:FL=1
MCRRLRRIAEELRGIVKETGTRISVAADVSPNYGEEKPINSVVFAGDYRMDHYNSGEEFLRYKNCIIEPRQMAIGRIAPGFEHEHEVRHIKK